MLAIEVIDEQCRVPTSRRLKVTSGAAGRAARLSPLRPAPDTDQCALLSRSGDGRRCHILKLGAEVRSLVSHIDLCSDKEGGLEHTAEIAKQGRIERKHADE